MRNCEEEKKRIVTKAGIQTWSATYMRGNDSRMIGDKGCDHERKGKNKRWQCAGDRKRDRGKQTCLMRTMKGIKVGQNRS
jgi:hypothetical protein